jgi:hypothetical protein
MEDQYPFGQCSYGHPLDEDGTDIMCEKLEFNAQ